MLFTRFFQRQENPYWQSLILPETGLCRKHRLGKKDIPLENSSYHFQKIIILLEVTWGLAGSQWANIGVVFLRCLRSVMASDVVSLIGSVVDFFVLGQCFVQHVGLAN